MNLCDFLDSIHYNVTTLFIVYRFVIQGIENQAKSMHRKLPHSTKRTLNGTQERLSGVSEVEMEWGHDFYTGYDCEVNIRVSCVCSGSWSDIPKAICMYVCICMYAENTFSPSFHSKIWLHQGQNNRMEHSIKVSWNENAECNRVTRDCNLDPLSKTGLYALTWYDEKRSKLVPCNGSS